MKKGCKYCSSDTPLMYLGANGTRKIEISFLHDMNSWVINQYSKDNVFEACYKIQYCPICGRKLPEGGN